MLERRTLTINGNDFSTIDGTCVRDYLHVSDIAGAHVQAVDLAETLDCGTFKAYNLGTGKGISNLEIVKAVESATGLDIDYELGPRRFGDPDELIADPNKFMSHTRWQPKYSQLETIVLTTLEWMEKTNLKIIKDTNVKD